jgi:hypothetical protein
MEDLKARMGALSLHTSSTDSLLARVARLPVDVLELIYKQFVRDFLFKRARARETICNNLLYQSGGMFAEPSRWRVGNPNRSRWRWKLSVLQSLRRHGYITQEQPRAPRGPGRDADRADLQPRDRAGTGYPLCNNMCDNLCARRTAAPLADSSYS